MSRASIPIALLSLALAFPAAADSRERKWRVSGSITGTYSNSIRAYNCFETKSEAVLAEHVTVNVKLVPRFTSRWEPGTGFGARMRVVPGGTWRLTGSFPPRSIDPATGEARCAAPEPVDCRGSLVGDSDGPSDAAFSADPVGRTMRGGFLEFGGYSESALTRRLPGPEVCNPYRESGDQAVGALWGIGGTDIESDAHGKARIRFPVRKLSGRRPFTYTGRTARPDPGECEAAQWISCTQSGGLVLKLRFKPVGR